MARCLLVYFSQGGTTARLAERIAATLVDAGLDVTMQNLSRNRAFPSARGFDLLGVGSPTYFFRPPFNVIDFLEALPDLSGLATFVFMTHGSYLGGAGTSIRRALRAKGGRELGYASYRGEDYFLPYLKQGYLFSPGHPTEGELDEAAAFGREVVARAAGKQFSRVDEEPQLGWVYGVERVATSRLFARRLYSRSFRVNRTACNGCGLCVRLCPTRNIAADAAGRPEWGRDCLLCLTCEMKCPMDAITSPLTWPILLPFFLYNVGHASRDPALTHVRVSHHHGKTRILQEGSDKRV